MIVYKYMYMYIHVAILLPSLNPLLIILETFLLLAMAIAKRVKCFRVTTFDLVTLVQTLQRLQTTTNSVIAVLCFLLFAVARSSKSSVHSGIHYNTHYTHYYNIICDKVNVMVMLITLVSEVPPC